MAKAKDPALKVRKFPMWLPWALIIVGVIGVLVSGILLKNTSKPPANVAVAAAPSSSKPSPKTVTSYTVPPTDPKYIAIPAIKISQVRIINLGLDKTGAIATPDNIYDTGWYNQSSRPGQSGATFIYGHVSSWQTNGIFYNLKKLTPGDTVAVTRGDNKVFTYRVVSSKIYPADDVDMNTVLSPVEADRPGLNLMTCTGTVIKGTSEFTERLVVFTSLVS